MTVGAVGPNPGSLADAKCPFMSLVFLMCQLELGALLEENQFLSKKFDHLEILLKWWWMHLHRHASWPRYLTICGVPGFVAMMGVCVS